MIMKIPVKSVYIVALVALSVSVDARSHRKHKEQFKHALEQKVVALEGQVAALEKALAEAKKQSQDPLVLQDGTRQLGSIDEGQKRQSNALLQQDVKALDVAGIEPKHVKTYQKSDKDAAVTSDLVGQVAAKEVTETIQLTNDSQSGVGDASVKVESWVMQETEPALYRQITGLIGQKDYVRAESCAQSYIEKFSEEKNAATVLFWLGEMKMLFGDLKEARGYYQQSLSLLKGKGRTPEVLLKIAMIAYQKGDNTEGDLYYNKLQNVYPGSTASHMARAQRKKYRAE